MMKKKKPTHDDYRLLVLAVLTTLPQRASDITRATSARGQKVAKCLIRRLVTHDAAHEDGIPGVLVTSDRDTHGNTVWYFQQA